MKRGRAQGRGLFLFENAKSDEDPDQRGKQQHENDTERCDRKRAIPGRNLRFEIQIQPGLLRDMTVLRVDTGRLGGGRSR